MASPELAADLIGEILLRFPPDEPEHLFRASLVCKPWRRIILSDPAFPRRYRAFHGGPPLLGFLHNFYTSGSGVISSFVSIAPGAPPCPSRRSTAAAGGPSTAATAASSSTCGAARGGHRQSLHEPDIRSDFYPAAVLCAAAGCDHGDCHGGPFVVVFVGSDEMEVVTRACVYSSEAGAWGAPASVNLGVDSFVKTKRGALIGNEIYFLLTMGIRILKYSFVDHRLSVIDSPNVYHRGAFLMPTEDGSLGFAAVRGSSLYMWSRKVDPIEVDGWVQYRVIELEKQFPIDRSNNRANVFGFAEGISVIFVGTHVGAFTFELSSGRVRFRASEEGKQAWGLW